MHGSVHDFIVSQTVSDWRTRPTGHGQGALIPTILPIEQPNFKQRQFKRILDIGSLNINGDMRTYDFCGAGPEWTGLVDCEEFVGVDLVGGRGVDIVMDAHNLDFPDNSFDLVMCTNTLEHDSDIQKTLFQGYRVLKPGGLFLVTTVDGDHEEHMEIHPVELPYNHISELDLLEYVREIKPKSSQLWHFNTDMLVRIEK